MQDKLPMRQSLLIPLVLLALPSFAAAQSYDDLAQVEIVPGWRDASGDHIAGIRITLAPGWITYWRAPGDAGIPPEFRFEGSDQISTITPHFPTPQVSYSNGMRSIGYYDSVVFPITVATAGQTGDIAISGEMVIGVCEEICIPVTLDFDTLLPAIGAPDRAISDALADGPLTREQADVGDVTCIIDPISDGLRLTASIEVARTGTTEFVVVEPKDPRIWVSEAEVTRTGGTLQATVDMVNPTGQPFGFDRSDVRFTVFGDDQAIDIQGCTAG